FQLLGQAKQKKDELLQEAKGFRKEQLKQAQTDAVNYLKRLEKYRRFRDKNPDYLYDIWLTEMKNVYAQMRKSGSRVEPLDKLMGQKNIDIIKKSMEGPKK